MQWSRYSGGERAGEVVEKITTLGKSRNGNGAPTGAFAQDRKEAADAVVEDAMKREAIREILALTRHQETTEIDTIFDPLPGAFAHPLDDLEGTDLPSPTFADM